MPLSVPRLRGRLSNGHEHRALFCGIVTASGGLSKHVAKSEQTEARIKQQKVFFSSNQSVQRLATKVNRGEGQGIRFSIIFFSLFTCFD